MHRDIFAILTVLHIGNEHRYTSAVIAQLPPPPPHPHQICSGQFGTDFPVILA